MSNKILDGFHDAGGVPIDDGVKSGRYGDDEDLRRGDFGSEKQRYKSEGTDKKHGHAKVEDGRIGFSQGLIRKLENKMDADELYPPYRCRRTIVTMRAIHIRKLKPPKT